MALRQTIPWLLAAILAIAFAQTEMKPQFEVASIKPADPNSRGTFIRNSPGGRLTITNMTLKEMMVMAWRVQPYQIQGGPPWIDPLHFDISAKAEGTTKQGDVQLM